jgi:hypothetical protein
LLTSGRRSRRLRTMSFDVQNLFKSGDKFPDPFIAPSNHYIPNSLDTALDFSLLLYHINPKYRRASTRVISHFITDFDVIRGGVRLTELSKKNKDDFYDLMLSGLQLKQHLHIMGQELQCFGNSFIRAHYPTTRWLIDDRSGNMTWYALSSFPEELVKYDYKEMKYEVPDPHENSRDPGRTGAKRVKLEFMDRPDLDASKIRFRTLDPKQVFILYSHISGKCDYVYKFEPWFEQEIKKGVLHQVNGTPKDMLQAVAKGLQFKFNDGQIFHLKAPTMAGMQARGWGIPETLLNYRSLHQIQVYRKMDEYVGMDYMLPFRLFSPKFGEGVTDIDMYNNLGQWQSQIGKLIELRRKDPTKMMSFAFPVNYQEFGANGKQLVPKDLIEYQDNSMLDDMGYPAELFRASLQVQQVPTAVRLFESTFGYIHSGFDQACKWMANKVVEYSGRDPVTLVLQRPTLADDLEKRHIYLQLAAGGEVSRAKAYRDFGIDDPVQEVLERTEEDIEIQKAVTEKQEAFEREMMGSVNDQLAMQQGQMAAQQGAPPPAGAPMPGPQDVSTDGMNPMQVQQKAEEMAQQYVGMPPGESSKALRSLEATNANLYAVVKDRMEKIRRQAESQGRAQLRGGQ